MGVRRAIVAFPSAGQIALVESIRHRFDPLAQAIPAHITLVFPFDSELDTNTLRTHMEEAVAGVDSFDVSYVGASIAEDEYVFLDIGVGGGTLGEIHDRLYGGPLLDYRSDRAYVPHTTVAHTTDQNRLREALAAASRLEIKFFARVNALTVYAVGPGPRRHTEFEVRLAN